MSITTTTADRFKRDALSGEPTVVLFGATWCAPCKVIKARLDSISAKLPKVRFLYIDADTDTDVFHDYGVRQVPTLFAFENGQTKDRIMAGLSTPQLQTWIDGVFEGELA